MLELIDRHIVPFFLSLYDAIGYVGVAIAIALETFVPVIPSEVIVPMAGWKVSQSVADPTVVEPLTGQPWGFVAALVVATIGAAAGSLAGYLIGAWGGRPLLDRYGRYVHINPDDLDRADAWFARYGDWAVLLCRLVPLLRALINYPAGVARFRVDLLAHYPKAGFPTGEVYGQTPAASLRLITCSGPFDWSTRHYRDNLVVSASAIP